MCGMLVACKSDSKRPCFRIDEQEKLAPVMAERQRLLDQISQHDRHLATVDSAASVTDGRNVRQTSPAGTPVPRLSCEELLLGNSSCLWILRGLP